LAVFFGVTKGQISKTVDCVTNALIQFAGDYMRFPNNNELAQIKAGFLEVIFEYSNAY
jgi:hypothetical protein